MVRAVAKSAEAQTSKNQTNPGSSTAKKSKIVIGIGRKSGFMTILVSGKSLHEHRWLENLHVAQVDGDSWHLCYSSPTPDMAEAGSKV